MTRWGRVVSSGASSNDTSRSGIGRGDFGKRHQRGRRPGRAGPRPGVALERAGKAAPGRTIACASRAPQQVRPSLPLFSFPSASGSGDGGSCNAGSPADALAASSRSGSASGGAPDEPSSSAAVEPEAASDQRPSRNSYLPCFRPFPNSTRIEDSLISRSASVGRQAQYFLHGRTRIVTQGLLDKAGHRAPRRAFAPAGPALGRRRPGPSAPCPSGRCPLSSCAEDIQQCLPRVGPAAGVGLRLDFRDQRREFLRSAHRIIRHQLVPVFV